MEIFRAALIIITESYCESGEAPSARATKHVPLAHPSVDAAAALMAWRKSARKIRERPW
jgi:hypothetical protein